MGNTSVSSRPPPERAVHPHVHGEHFTWSRRLKPDDGSSPRTWGTLRRWKLTRICLRFIPTYMGNTYSSSPRDQYKSVHPHVHGEHSCRPRRVPSYFGSSPRTWGTLQSERCKRPEFRFIPTCMGNTRMNGGWMKMAAVHPHVHGEHSTGLRPTPARVGSSPRTWGTPLHPDWCLIL